MADLSNVYLLIQYHPHGDELHSVIAGKFFLDTDHFEVLEDHVGGWLHDLQKEEPEKVSRVISKLARSMYWKVVSVEDIRLGLHPDLIPETRVDTSDPGPESIFEYHRVGMAEAQTLEWHQGKAYLDGHGLSVEELQQMLDNVHAGSATLSYKNEAEPVSKTEESFMTLAKIEPGLEMSLRAVRDAVKKGTMHPDVLRRLSQEIFTDSMVPGMGNKKAYADFLARPKQGVHVHIDGNSFGQINKTGRGFEAGNDAIVAMGKAIRESVDEAVGRKQAKAHRVGGDEFRVFVPTHEHAALFARALRQHLEAIPPIDGTHHLSVSMGFGHTPDHAELALIDAKQAKKATGLPAGQEKTHAASRIPGFEGIVPTGADQLPLKPLAPGASAEQILRPPEAPQPPVASSPEKPSSPGKDAPAVGLS